MPVPSSSFGYLPDYPDDKDWKFSDLAKAQPLKAVEDEVDLRPHVTSILNQGSLGSCVAHGILGAIRLKHVLDGIQNPLLGNRLHVYGGARALIGTLDWDSGCYIRDGFRYVNAMGFMPESETDNGYQVSEYREMPSPREQRVMYDQKNKQEGQVEYYRIWEQGDDRIAALKQALSNHVIPVLGTATTREFLSYRRGILRKPSSTTRQTGGHAFYLCGYTREYAIGVNSWDDDWGFDGFMYIGWDYIRWRETRDIWGVAKAPYYSHHLKAA